MFLFPFRWEIPHLKDKKFSEQIDLANIDFQENSKWKNVIQPVERSERENLYNEKNFFYEFVHPALYDQGGKHVLVKHFERTDLSEKNGSYIICLKDKRYQLKLTAINLNFYSTGIGFLTFYLQNDRYEDEQDILNINQYGRRIYPPFYKDIFIRSEIPEYIDIEGLSGHASYKEDFMNYSPEMSNKPARFICTLIHEAATNVSIKPVIDDRMYVMCAYCNDRHIGKIKNNIADFLESDFWYKYVFVDSKDVSCQNDEMHKKLIDQATYLRWQKWGTVYGISRYSMMMLTSSDCPAHLLDTFQNVYVRMTELVLVQRASLLRFSSEVTNISALKKGEGLSHRVSDLYQEYIRFVNQIHFREISAQDQGIELYNMLYIMASLEKEVEKLDHEIEELHNHVSLIEDRKNSKVMDLLTFIAAIFLPVTVISGFFGMNTSETMDIIKSYEAFLIIVALIFSFTACMVVKKHINHKY